ncbi:polysaccharide pyruvyl transferase family protein [Thermodesulfobacteriota bacterium]
MTKNLEDREFRICLFGALLDVGNMGCRALTFSLISQFLDAKPKAKINLLCGNRSSYSKKIWVSNNRMEEVKIVNYRLSPKARLQEHLLWILFLACIHRIIPIISLRKRIYRMNPWLKCLKKADFVGDISGGDSFSDIYGLHRLLLGTLPSLIAILMRKDLVLLPQTYGPYKSAIARIVARFILSRAHRIYSRDTQSITIVRDLLGKQAEKKAIVSCPDVAFSLMIREPANLAIDPQLSSQDGQVLVGFNVSGLLYIGGYTRKNMFGLRCDYPELVRHLLARLLDIAGIHVLLVPHTFGSAPQDDQGACRRAWEAVVPEVKDRVHLLTGEYDQNEIKAIIGRCDFFIGSRMHACIAALSQGIPSIGLAYSRKFLGVFDMVGMSNMVLDMRQMSAEELIERCLSQFEERQTVTESLSRSVADISSRLKSCFRNDVLGVA